MSPVLPSVQSVWRLNQLVRKIKPDIIHGWLYHGSLAAQFASFFSFRKIPVIWSVQCSMYSLGFEKRSTAAVFRLCALLSRHAAAIIFVSSRSQSQHRELRYSLERSCLIPNGIDIDLFFPSKDSRSSVRSELRLSENTFLIGLINRYHPMKDHESFLRAAAILSREHPDVHFLLAGREVDRDNLKLASLIRDLDLSSRTHLLGERNDIARLTGALDILSLSSFYGEGFPVIVGEAMACGVPCVVTDIGDSAWIVGDTGLVVPAKNPAALAGAWQELINLGPGGRVALGKAARSRVNELFTLDSCVAQYEALYHSIIREKTSARSRFHWVDESLALQDKQFEIENSATAPIVSEQSR